MWSMPWLKLGTRGSPLAIAQAHEARRRLASAHARPESEVEIVVIRTTGDMIQDRALSESGGKGMFTKELDAALLSRRIDFAVHSAKDLPTVAAAGLVIAGYLPREDARDVLISAIATTVRELPRGAIVGSASLRRQAQLKRLRPDLGVTLLRGNVETRLRTAESGEIAGTLLALAGLKRLGLAHRATEILDTSDFLPAVGQGAIAIMTCGDDERTMRALAPILDHDAGVALAVERAFLAVLDGSCRTPIAGHAALANGRVHFRGLVLRPDGSELHDASFIATEADGVRLGTDAGRDILGRLPAGFLQH